jgi:hypothetical protein
VCVCDSLDLEMIKFGCTVEILIQNLQFYRLGRVWIDLFFSL